VSKFSCVFRLPFNCCPLAKPIMKPMLVNLQDRIFYDDILPPTGSQQISFARLLQLLQDRRVKRITLLADGKVAIVEVSDATGHHS
jgi:hypothetical protein